MANDKNIPDTSGLSPDTESFSGVRNLRPDVVQRSFTDAGLLRPRASGSASATPTAQPASPTLSPSTPAAPAAPADDSTQESN